MAEQPEWLTTWTDQVCECLYATDAMPPISCHWHREKKTWEISIFFAATEIVGGERDGERLPWTFVLDALQLADLFDGVESMSWQSDRIHDHDDLGAHFSIRGIVKGHSIWLRLLAEAPEQFEPGRYASFSETPGVIDIWDA